MTELDGELGPIAVELIAEFGKLVSYSAVTNSGGYDPVQGRNGQRLESEPVDVRVVPDDLGTRTTFNGNLIKGGDMILLQAASGSFVPAFPGYYTINESKYNIVENGIKTTYSGDDACLYSVQVRK